MNNPLLDQSPYALTDGWGAQRLCIAMLGIQGKLTFRIAKEFDEALLWRLSSGIGAGPNRSLKNSSHDDNQHFSVKKNLRIRAEEYLLQRLQMAAQSARFISINIP